MNLVYLDCDAFVRCIKQKGYEIYIHRGSHLFLYLSKKFHVFQIYRGYIVTDSSDLQELFRKDRQMLNTLLNECTQPQNRTPHEDGLAYGGITYHYAFEFKLASIGKTINVVTSNFNDNTNDFSGLCLENGFKVISIKKTMDDAFFEIVRSVVDGYLSVERLYKMEHPGEELDQLLRVKDKDFLKKFEGCKKSKESVTLNKMLNEKMRPYLDGQSDVRKIPQKTQIDFIKNYPIALCSLPRICSEIINVEWITFFTIFKGGFRFEQHVNNRY